MAKKQDNSRYLAELNPGYANELLTRFENGFVKPLQNLINALENNFKIEVTPDVLHDCVTHSGIDTIAAFRDSQKGDAHDMWAYEAREKFIESAVNAVRDAIKPFSDGVQILYNHRSCDPELFDLVEISEKGIVTIKEETINFITESAKVYTKTEDGKRLCDILYEVAPLLQEFLDIIHKNVKNGKVMSPELSSGIEYWFPARLFTIEDGVGGKKTIKPVEQINFDVLD